VKYPKRFIVKYLKKALDFHYDYLSIGRVAKTATAHHLAKLKRSQSQTQGDFAGWQEVNRELHAFYVDCLVISRLLIACAVLSIGLPDPNWFRQALVAISWYLIADVFLSHLNHLLDEDKGSAGSNARWSARRSFVIAMLNLGVVIVAIGNLFMLNDERTRLGGIAASAASIVGSDRIGESRFAIGLSVFGSAIGLFMFAIIVTTVLTGFRARTSLEQADKSNDRDD